MKTKMNIKLLKQVRDAILKHPDQFYMGWWFDRSVFNGNAGWEPAGGCGTAGCIGGWAIHLGRKTATLEDARVSVSTEHDSRVAADLLGIPIKKKGTSETHPLFFVEQWPEKFKTMHDKARSYKGQAKAAAARIDHFIKTRK